MSKRVTSCHQWQSSVVPTHSSRFLVLLCGGTNTRRHNTDSRQSVVLHAPRNAHFSHSTLPFFLGSSLDTLLWIRASRPSQPTRKVSPRSFHDNTGVQIGSNVAASLGRCDPPRSTCGLDNTSRSLAFCCHRAPIRALSHTPSARVDQDVLREGLSWS